MQWRFVTAANLGIGDPISSSNLDFKLNETSTLSYLGVPRSVNIINLPNYKGRNMLDLFDKTTGVLVESFFAGSNENWCSFKIVETNLWAPLPTPSPSPTQTPTDTPSTTPTPTSTPSPLPTPTFTPTPTPQAGPDWTMYGIIIAVVAVIAVIFVVFIIRRRHAKTGEN